MTLSWIILALVIVFAFLWYRAPSGWMTNIKTTLLAGLAGAPGVIEYLAINVDWREILTPQNAAIVAAVLGLMALISRSRSKIRGK